MRRSLLSVSGKGRQNCSRMVIHPECGIMIHGWRCLCPGKKKFVRLREDWPHASEFIYSFADRRRFFCDYDADTAMLDFVVDLDAHTNVTANWPTHLSGLRKRLEHRATGIVYQTKGVVRMASDEELEEVRSYLSRTPSDKIRAASLPFCDLGVWRFYADRNHLLLDLSTNRRHSCADSLRKVHL